MSLFESSVLNYVTVLTIFIKIPSNTYNLFSGKLFFQKISKTIQQRFEIILIH